MTGDFITCHFHVLHFFCKLVNNIFVNNARKTANSGGFPITHFLAKKEENLNQKIKQQLEIKLKLQVRVKLTMIIFEHIKKYRSEKMY